MGLIAKDKGGGDLTPIPEDLHLALCYGIWDLGSQFTHFSDRPVHKVVIVWEIPGCRGDFERDGKMVNLPRAISKIYTLSLHEKANLRKNLESWRGKKFSDEELKGFDLKKLLGAPCQIQIIHNVKDDKTYANISAIIKAPIGTKIKPENTLTFFSFEEGMDIPSNTPEWIVSLIKKAEEYQTKGQDNHEGDQYFDEDAVPF
jgi:hypothetical protein